MVSFICITLLSAALVSATPLSTSSSYRQSQLPFTLAPLHVPSPHHAHNALNSSYIVVFKKDAPSTVFQTHFNFLGNALAVEGVESVDGPLQHVYETLLRGYSGTFSSDVIDMIRSQPEVDYVEQDQLVHTQDIQNGAPWGLARVSQRNRLTFGTFSRYFYDKRGGNGVDVYVIDTGVKVDHEEFEGRARWGKTIPQNDLDIDGNGHGTHCAGTIASRKYGVAKGANIVAVKVLGTNGSGTMSDVIRGVEWAAESALKKKKEAEVELAATGSTSHKGSVANMSLGGGKSRTLELAVNGAVESGMHFAVAAGNDNRDACDYSPAGAELAITVGASSIVDERAYFSNHGSCVDVFAPGLNILSTWNNGRTNTISGTSMASPHTAGLVAYYLSLHPSSTFNPNMNTFVPPAMNLEQQFVSSFTRFYKLAYNGLPSWMVTMMPSPSLVFAVAEPMLPTPPGMTPDIMKRALLGLSTQGALRGETLPKDTPNMLIFNNATDSTGHEWLY